MKIEECKAPSMETIDISPFDNYCGIVTSPGIGSGSGSGSGSGRDEGFVA